MSFELMSVYSLPLNCLRLIRMNGPTPTIGSRGLCIPTSKSKKANKISQGHVDTNGKSGKGRNYFQASDW